MNHTPPKKGGAMPGGGRPKSDRKRMFRELELNGLNLNISIMAQNVIEYNAPEKSKEDLYKRIKNYQPEFLEPVKSIIEL